MAQDEKETDAAGKPAKDENRRIVNRRLVTYVMPVTVLVAVIAGLLLFPLGVQEKATLWWFIVAVAILVISFIQGQVFNTESKVIHDRISDEVHKTAEQTKAEIKQIIEVNVDPHVTMLTSKSEVRFAAAEMIEKAMKANSSNDKPSDNERNSLGVQYFGSASLTPPEDEYRKASHSHGYEDSDVVRYQNALNDLRTSTTKVVRYIHLLDNDTFALRGATTRKDYLDWLERQVIRLRASPNYVLYDARRAPEWNGPRSSILTDTAILDIIGDGSAGLLLDSVRIPTALFRASRSYFYAAQQSKNQPKRYSMEEANQLQEILDRLKQKHKELLSPESDSRKS